MNYRVFFKIFLPFKFNFVAESWRKASARVLLSGQGVDEHMHGQSFRNAELLVGL